MSSHDNHDSHSAEPKKVAFRTPLIMGLVTIFIILVCVSTCDKTHHHENEEKGGANIKTQGPVGKDVDNYKMPDDELHENMEHGTGSMQPDSVAKETKKEAHH